MREMLELMREDAAKDFAKWPNNSSDDKIDVWTAETRPKTIEEGVREIYNDYLVPRRHHLYVTHSVTNTARAVGYGTDLNAGIPEAQSATAVLKAGITAEYDGTLGAVVIRNTNAETVDVSDWTLSGPVAMSVTLKAEVPDAVLERVSIDSAKYVHYFMAEATAVPGDKKRFTVEAVLNPDTVPAPLFGSAEDLAEAVKVETDVESGNTVVSVGVINAKVGLWYGLEAGDGVAADYLDDAPSFILATNASERLVLSGTPRDGASGFYRVKVLPIRQPAAQRE